MSCNQVHAKFGHSSETLTRSTASQLSIVLKCGIVIRKKLDNRSYVRPNWFMLVDAASGIKFLSFWITNGILEICNVIWMRRMFYETAAIETMDVKPLGTFDACCRF